jgi:hypothetical protein
MSMICWLVGLSPAQIAALRATPSLASDVAIVGQSTLLDQATKRMSPEQRTAFEKATKGARARIKEAQSRLAAIGPFEQALGIEKSWHMLHYLFTGHVDASDAPGNALMTGQALGENLGYGPARLQDESRTREFAQFVASQDVARLQARVNFQEMTRLKIYAMPAGPGSAAQYESELRAEVAEYFPLLRDYVGRMAARKYGLLIWLS